MKKAILFYIDDKTDEIVVAMKNKDEIVDTAIVSKIAVSYSLLKEIIESKDLSKVKQLIGL